MNQLGPIGMGGMAPSASPQIVAYSQAAPDEGKMSVSIDFGTTFSGVVSFLTCFGALDVADTWLLGVWVISYRRWPGSTNPPVARLFRKLPQDPNVFAV